MKNVPLIVDLDNTLIYTDLLYESSVAVIKKRPLLAILYPFWLFKGKGYLKDQLVKRFTVDVSKLPFNDIVIDYIRERKKIGSQVILATASHKYYAFAVAKHVGLFDDVMASNKDFNLSSHNKASRLVDRFGIKGFDYMGDHMRDLPVWEASNLSILVNVSDKVINKTKHLEVLVLSKKGLNPQ